jgi:hypothetical protein
LFKRDPVVQLGAQKYWVSLSCFRFHKELVTDIRREHPQDKKPETKSFPKKAKDGGPEEGWCAQLPLRLPREWVV